MTKAKIDMSECVFLIDEDSEHTLEDVVLEMFIKYVNNNTQFTIEKV